MAEISSSRSTGAPAAPCKASHSFHNNLLLKVAPLAASTELLLLDNPFEFELLLIEVFRRIFTGQNFVGNFAAFNSYFYFNAGIKPLPSPV